MGVAPGRVVHSLFGSWRPKLAVFGSLVAILTALVACQAASAQPTDVLPAGAVSTPGELWSWGGNSYGQLGNGNETNSDIPTAGPQTVFNASGGFTDVSEGADHTLAVDSDGDVWSWGQNTYGQLGYGGGSTPVSSSDPSDVYVAEGNAEALTSSPLPTEPGGAELNYSPAEQVAAGSNFSLALDTNGNVWAWGDNNDGQIGQGSTQATYTWPNEVTTLPNVVQIAAGQQFALALRSDGTVWAWGSDSEGQLGNDTVGGTETAPVEVVGVGGTGDLSNVVQIAAGSSTAYALLANGTVVSWGNGTDGSLGDGATTAQQDVPIAVSGLSGVTSISAGQYHGLATVGSSGAVWAWGDDSNGQLGNNSTTNSDTPVAVDGLGGSGSLSGVGSVSGGGYYSLAITDSGTVYAWGQNNTGQLGNGNTTDQHVPAQVSGIGQNNGAASVSAGDGLSGSTSFIIGEPAVGLSATQLEFAPGEVGQDGQSSPVTVTDTGDAPLTIDFTQMIGQDADAFQITSDSCSGNTLEPTGSAAPDQTACGVGLRQDPVAAGPLQASLLISQDLASGAATLPVVGAGLPSPTSGLAFSTAPNALFAAGSDSNGQLGAGDVGATFVTTPTGLQPSALSFVESSAGGTSSLGLRPDGTVWAWGGNSAGQLGNASNTDSWTPTQVPLPGPAVAVSAGQSHSLAIEEGGTVWSWGSNSNGQLGNGTTTSDNVPGEVSGLVNIVAVSAGATHSLALQASGAVWAWGNNTNGQLGNGTTTQQTTPIKITGLPANIVAVSTAGNSSLALTASGTIYAWGANGNGQLGNGTTTQETSPVEVSSISTAVAVAGGSNFGLALLANGTVDSWGANGYGQLGNGGTTQATTPVVVSSLTGVASIAAGSTHSVAITSSGEAYSWGYNSSGQLGIGSTSSEDAPVQMTAMSEGAAAAGIGSSASHTLLISQPYASASAATLVFSSESPGDDSSALTETITNTGRAPLVIGQDSIIGADGDQFKVTGDGCAGTTVAPGVSCAIGVRYEALVSGSPDATLRIASNSPTGATLITLDPPAPTIAKIRKVRCQAVMLSRRSVKITCTAKPALPESGTTRIRLTHFGTVVRQRTVDIRNRRVSSTFSLWPSAHRRGYSLVIQLAGGASRAKVRFDT